MGFSESEKELEGHNGGHSGPGGGGGEGGGLGFEAKHFRVPPGPSAWDATMDLTMIYAPSAHLPYQVA